MSAAIETTDSAPSAEPAPLPEQPKPAPEPGAPPAPMPSPEQPVLRIDLGALHGQRIKLVDRPRFAFELAKSKAPEPGSLYHWGVAKDAPAWLVKAMAVGEPVNKVWTEAEFDATAAKIAGLPLGRKGA